MLLPHCVPRIYASILIYNLPRCSTSGTAVQLIYNSVTVVRMTHTHTMTIDVQ